MIIDRTTKKTYSNPDRANTEMMKRTESWIKDNDWRVSMNRKKGAIRFGKKTDNGEHVVIFQYVADKHDWTVSTRLIKADRAPHIHETRCQDLACMIQYIQEHKHYIVADC